MRVWPAAVARVNEEVADMKPFAAKDGVATVEPWDYRYYQEKVRKAKYDLSEDEIKPYFELDELVNGMFWSAEQLYDLKFTENTGKVPVFHPDVRTFEVTNAKTGDVIGLFYLDTYAREGKRSGAWATDLSQLVPGLLGDKIVLGSNNNNFTKPSAGQPVLISLDDASTLFHEFGHAIHYSADRREISVARRVAARLRRISEPGERELAADPAGARASSPGTTRPASRCRQALVDKIKKAGDVQPGLRDGRISVVGAGRHEAAHSTRTGSSMPTRSRRRRWPRSACPRKW